MSAQIFLTGKFLGVDDFLHERDYARASLPGRSRWVSLLSEVLPRALLKELNLSDLLLGTSGGGQFFVVLPGEVRGQAEAFLDAAGRDAERISGGTLQIVWATTENLGEWPAVRKRLQEELATKRGTPAALAGPDFFAPSSMTTAHADEGYLASLAEPFDAVSWSPARPAAILPSGDGHYSWRLGTAAGEVPLAHHDAAPIRGAWGVLRGDVDGFEVRLRRIETIEEQLQLSLLYKNFFAGELQALIVSMPDMADRVSILYSGGDDFAVHGAWDSLIPLARELQRMFCLLIEGHLKELPGAEGKTISMSLALAASARTPLAEVFADAGRTLELAKAHGRDSFHLFGRTLEWKQLKEASDTKDLMVDLVKRFGCSTQFLSELRVFYREAGGIGARRRVARYDKPWRFRRRLNRTLEPRGRAGKEFLKLRTELSNEMIGKNVGQARIRPTGRVALEWAEMETKA